MSGNLNPDPGRKRSASERYASAARNASGVLMIPTMMVISPVAGFLLGKWLEGRFGHAPWLSFLGLVLGAVAGGRQVMKIVRRSQVTDRNQDREP